MQEISSAQNPRLKQVARLHTSRGRKQQNRIVIFGWRELQRAFTQGIEIEEVFVCPTLAGEVLDQVTNTVEETSATIFGLPQDVFKKIQYGDRSDGVIGTAKRPEIALAEKTGEDAFFLVLQGVEKPGNLGAILRTADGAGAAGVIVADAVTDVFHPNAIRSSMGTVFTVPVVVQSSDNAIKWLSEHDVKVVITRPDAKLDFFETDLKGKVAIVVGSESDGLSDAWDLSHFAATKLPMSGIADSLNVSVATGIVAYEARRQRMNG